ncbi:MAG: PKD domain-containing protein [Bacteroidia bacterium]
MLSLVDFQQQCFRNNAFNFTNNSTIKKGQLLDYLWTFGNGDSSRLKSVANHNYDTEDSFTVRLIGTSDLNCMDTTQMLVVTHPQGIADFSVSLSNQCLDQNLYSFTNNSSVKTGSQNFIWNFGDNITSINTNATHKYTKAGAYTVELISTTNLDCKDTLTKLVTVFASPIAKFTVDKDKQCYRNNSFNFTSGSSITNGSITQYNWTFGDNTSATTQDVANKHYNSEDSFTVQLVVSSDNACKDTLSSMVYTFAQPTALFSINNSIQCFNQQDFDLVNQSKLKYGDLTYQWDFGDGNSSTDTNVRITYLNAGTYDIRLISSSENQCRDTSIQQVVLNVSPKAEFAIDKDKQCFKDNIFNFTNNSTIASGNISIYRWFMGDNNGFTSRDVNGYSYATEDTFDVQLITTSDLNCKDTFNQMAITFAQPMVDFTVPNDSQCWQKNYFVINNNTTLKYGSLSNSWDFGDNTYSSDFTPITKNYPNTSASYLIKYKAVSDNGCSDSMQHMVALLERPISDFTINDSIQCFNGHLFQFNNTTDFSAMNTLSYWWDYDNGIKHQGFTPQDATYNTPDFYNVSLVTYSTLTNCFDTAIKVVIPAPHANVNFSMNLDSQCFRSNEFNLNNQSNVKFGTMEYTWDFGDGSSDTATNPTKTYSTEAGYTIKLLVNTNYNCLDSFDYPIGFHPTPIASFNINDTDQCLNEHRFDFTNTSQIASGTFTQDWWFDDLETGTNTDFLGKQFIDPETHQVRLAVISNNGCADTTYRYIYLEDTRNSKIQFAENDSQCWKGNAFDFSNLNTNPKVSFVTAKWIYGDGQTSNGIDPAPMQFSKDGNYSVTLITESSIGCQDTSTVDVVIHPHPVTSFTAEDVCFPEPVQFTNTSSISSGTVSTYLWDFGDFTSSGVPSPQHNYAFAGLYDVQLISFSEYMCSDTVFVASAARVDEKPKANFDFNQLPTVQQDQSRFKFNNKSSSNSTSYEWDFGNQTGSSEEHPIGIFEDTGRYNVSLVAFTDAGCSDTFVRNTGMIIPDFFYYLPNAFSPNGDVHNNIYRGLGSKFVFEFKMEIFNRWGEKLYETNDITKGWDGYYNGELCMEGAYLCRVQIVPFKGVMQAYEQMFMLMR